MFKIHKLMIDQISEWKAWSERKLTIELMSQNKTPLTLIRVYGQKCHR